MKNLLFFISIACVLNVSAQVSKPAIKAVNKINLSCNGLPSGSISIIASNGRIPYMYSDNGGVTFQASNSFTNLSAGVYTVLIKDAINQFSDSQKVEITQPSKLVLHCTGNMQCGNNSGMVSVSVSGGTPPYNYSWNAGTQTNSQTQTGLAAGVYIVTVFDAMQCSDTCSVVLVQQGSSTSTYKVGDSISCGYIFYVDPNPDSAHPCSRHYLVCSYADQSNSVTWYNSAYTYQITNAATDILFDRKNALAIDSFSLAANTCSTFTTDSCTGWYLPSKTELDSMYTNLSAKNIGSFAKEGYWSSVEGSKRHNAWIVDFLNGREIQNDKSNKYHVRAICDVWLPNK
ncbi:MAG: DUF1566 domain-containing protein [Parafilimonas sp.]